VLAAHERSRHAPGAVAAARALAAAADRATAAAEHALVRLLRAADARGWRAAFPLAGRRWPVAFPAARVVVDVTGWAWRPGADRAPDPPVGWSVLRFGWPELTGRSGTVPEAISAVVA
jgi:hypothetical protein